VPAPARLILASASPRRRELLAAAGFSFEVRHVDVEEQPRAGEAPRDYVRRLAAEKSARALEAVGGAVGGDLVVIGADTTVVVNGEILGKPQDDREASRMLERLSGRTHLVLTGLSLRNARHEIGIVEETTVWFAPLSNADIAWYVTSGDWRDKAGGYAIQGLAARFIPRIEGSYSNVVGLPVAAVSSLLAEFDGPPGAVASRG
jgi:septum formation protein